MPKVSIIMPAYNVEYFIQDSILSIRKQVYENWELIIINDGSTDDTLTVAEALSNKDKRIQIYSQPNMGVSAARNLGLSYATGSLVAFLDGDDLWDPLFLNKMVYDILEKCGELVICGFNRMYPNGTCVKHNNQYSEGPLLLSVLKNKITIIMGTFLVSKQLIERFSLRFTENCMISEDMEFIYKILAITEVSIIKKELMTYRRRLGSATQADWKWEPYISSIYAMERVLDFINKYYIHAGKDEVKKMLQDLICYLKCDFLWKSIKFGEHLLAQELINKGWQNDLQAIKMSEKRLSKKVKYKIVSTKNSSLWTIIFYIITLMNYIKKKA